MNPWLRRALLGGAAVGAGFGLWQAFRPMPVLVDVATLRRGDLLVTVDDDGRTRVRDRYTISAPIAGRLLRTVLDPGDAVRARDTVVAEFAPIPAALLDARSRAEAEAQVRRAEAAIGEAEARVQQSRADAAFASAELERMRELAARQIEGQASLDAAEAAERSSREAVHAAELAVQVARHELELARASLLDPLADEVDPNVRRERDDDKPEPQRRLQLRSPIDGRVLRVFEESARSLLAGTPILEVGDTGSLEIVADYLTQDAVLVRPGMPVRIEGWGGASALHGRVRVVEPGGYTKISALGVEEQRVDVVVDPAGDPADWQPFGDGYRVELRIVVDEAKDALLVPTGALFQRGGGWAAYVVEGGFARRRDVRLGKRGGLEAEVLAGLAEGEQVILYPSDLVGEGMRIEGRGT